MVVEDDSFVIDLCPIILPVPIVYIVLRKLTFTTVYYQYIYTTIEKNIEEGMSYFTYYI